MSAAAAGDLVRVIGKAAPPLLAALALSLAAGAAGAGAIAAGGAFALAPALYGLVFGVRTLAAALPAALLRLGAALSLGIAAAVGLAGPLNDAPAFVIPPFATTLPVEAITAILFDGACALAGACVVTLAFLSVAGRAPDLAEGEP